uniref:Secreted protein n=1 Tax=Steinernema glaseri TaxID=37863 RepID=A0A1I7YHB8_9BILA
DPSLRPHARLVNGFWNAFWRHLRRPPDAIFGPRADGRLRRGPQSRAEADEPAPPERPSGLALPSDPIRCLLLFVGKGIQFKKSEKPDSLEVSKRSSKAANKVFECMRTVNAFLCTCS